MEDYIYILIGVIWLAASVYKASQKNKKQAAAKKSGAPQPKARQGVAEARSILEELLGGQEARIPAPEEQDLSIYESETIPAEVDPTVRNFQSEYKNMGHKGLESSSGEGISSHERIEFVDEMKSLENKGVGQNKIDLRKAIIYSAILERPYT